MLAYGHLATRAAILCRNGNLVAVNGELTSQEFFNRNEGTSQIQTFLVRHHAYYQTIQKASTRKRLSKHRRIIRFRERQQMNIQFTVHGEPMGKQRPKATSMVI